MSLTLILNLSRPLELLPALGKVFKSADSPIKHRLTLSAEATATGSALAIPSQVWRGSGCESLGTDFAWKMFGAPVDCGLMNFIRSFAARFTSTVTAQARGYRIAGVSRDEKCKLQRR